MSDYSMYVYYKGDSNYKNKKAMLFGKYEEQFEKSYKGNPEDKEEKFKEFIQNLLYEQASDIYMFGTLGVDKMKCYNEYLDNYFNPEMNVDLYEF